MFSNYPITNHWRCRTRGRKLDIALSVRPRASDGLLFWVSEEEMTPYSDYLAVGLRGGFAQVGYNLGSGEALLVNNHSRIDDDRWHSIRVYRSLLSALSPPVDCISDSA